MKYNPEIHHRRSIRLKGYDYSQPGMYFVTLCAHRRECLLGEIIDGEMVLNDAGKMVKRWFYELENKFTDIQCDEMIIMPNHIHFIVSKIAPKPVGADLRVCPCLGEREDSGEGLGEREGSGERSGEQSALPLVVQWLKTMTTNEYIRGVKNNGWSRFNGKLWQRNYYEHIIRNEKSLENIRNYIINNPAQWAEDENYSQQKVKYGNQ